eukprot:4618536-Pleurochrysis_carterae.AAC.1
MDSNYSTAKFKVCLNRPRSRYAITGKPSYIPRDLSVLNEAILGKPHLGSRFGMLALLPRMVGPGFDVDIFFGRFWLKGKRSRGSIAGLGSKKRSQGSKGLGRLQAKVGVRQGWVGENCVTGRGGLGSLQPVGGGWSGLAGVVAGRRGWSGLYVVVRVGQGCNRSSGLAK